MSYKARVSSYSLFNKYNIEFNHKTIDPMSPRGETLTLVFNKFQKSPRKLNASKTKERKYKEEKQGERERERREKLVRSSPQISNNG
jgi:hypothetical protein